MKRNDMAAAGSVDVIIIGAGISGLTAAFYLKRSGRTVLILDAADAPGGVMRTAHLRDCVCELGPNTVLWKPPLRRLVRALGIEDEVVYSNEASALRYIVRNDTLYPLKGGPGAIFSGKLLSPFGKLRIFGDFLVSASKRQDESAHDFFARRLGSEVAERLVAPALSGVYACDPRKLSIRSAFPWLWANDCAGLSLIRGAIKRMKGSDREARRSITFRTGLQALPDALARALGDDLKLRFVAERLTRTPSGWRVEGDGHSYEGTEVVLSGEAGSAAGLVATFAPEIASEIRAVPYVPIGVLHLLAPEHAFAELPRAFGFLETPQPGSPLLGVIFSSSVFEGRAPQGSVLMTCIVGGAFNASSADANVVELQKQVVRRVVSLLRLSQDPEVIRSTFYPRAIPSFPLGHHELVARIAKIESDTPGLHVLGSWNSGVSVPDRLESAERLAARIAQSEERTAIKASARNSGQQAAG